MADSRQDWRADFRLHAMNFEQLDHQEQEAAQLLDCLETRHEELRAAGGEALDGAFLSTRNQHPAQIWLRQVEKPHGPLAWAKFINLFLVACAREAPFLESQTWQLRRAVRLQQETWNSV